MTAQTVISPQYPPHIDVTKTPLAYGDRAVPRLNKELNDANLVMRQRAVRSLSDYLHDPEHIATALREGIAESLKNLLSDADVTIREKSLECLNIIAQHAIGRDVFLDQGILIPVSNLWDDKEDIVRRNAHRTLKMVSETPLGAEGLVQSKLVPKLVTKLPDELDEIKILILDELHFCMAIDTTDALATEGMETLTALLVHTNVDIKGRAARNIMDLSVPLAGKNKAVEVGTVPHLVKLLEDEDVTVRANAAGALMMITITTKGKYTAINSGALEPLVNLLSDERSTEIKVNALKAITCLSEAPEGREWLGQHVEKISELMTDKNPAVVKHATIAVNIITWRP
ncbi:radial spoke head 14 homolog [Watersipora subatra]|uniref:radial spoke head 14 homolog n=1 Tax=Watersipora subatra TaxID=2589382 RepID=UPI00355C72F0